MAGCRGMSLWGSTLSVTGSVLLLGSSLYIVKGWGSELFLCD